MTDSTAHGAIGNTASSGVQRESQQRELGKFLQAHRERIPGLPREEVAQLSGLGLAWYTWLEQGRVAASRPVVEAVARTLRLDDHARRHALALAGLHAPPRRARHTHDQRHAVARLLQPVLDSWPTSPALLLDHSFDIIGWNNAYAALWTDPGLVDDRRRNLLYLMVTSRLLGSTLHEWEAVTKAVLAQFRSRADGDFQDERVQEIFMLLEADKPDLKQWWENRSAHEFTSRKVTVATATVGEILMIISLFRPTDDPDATILLQTPVTPTDRDRVRQLTELPARWVGNDRSHGFYDH
ncbi:helix-turn-helix transcriptional regulator [Frankia sp. CiP3]|uniref:helix-turn-helix transcriptional regulator n=1 Tax=Frankia sp. CiP3 TaxID=2880971 RepID=UPI001EF3EE8D|nr:helix-turn-helix transcriptional regulator [Frankia sp. CiP3]